MSVDDDDDDDNDDDDDDDDDVCSVVFVVSVCCGVGVDWDILVESVCCDVLGVVGVVGSRWCVWLAFLETCMGSKVFYFSIFFFSFKKSFFSFSNSSQVTYLQCNVNKCVYCKQLISSL
ncbi:hypothetical protein CI610_03277 [invertebrate metagenome]|uniref:Uncharacterized protein n=1 Tax=invertebrate metagenome TaxID=1711999 RepID=A0A2H9T3I9_9ZZZZ